MTARLLLTTVVAAHAWAGTPLTAEELRARELAAAVADVTAKRAGACLRLHDAVTPYWGAADRLEWPRQLRKPLPESVSGVRSAADACAAAALAADEKAEWSVSRLLASPLLQDEALRKQVLERDGGPPSIGRGGGSGGGLPVTHSSIDPALAAAGAAGLAPALVHKVIRQNRNQPMYCYESQLPRLQGRKGKVLVQFEITAEGKTSAVVMAESTLNDAAVEACVLDRVANWVFPRPKQGKATVSYPFEFGPAPK